LIQDYLIQQVFPYFQKNSSVKAAFYMLECDANKLIGFNKLERYSGLLELVIYLFHKNGI
jgi:hypothetical protein